MIKRHLRFVLVLCVAVIVRLFFMSFPPFKTDMDSFIAWGEQMLSVGPGRFYTSGIWSDYAPGYMYFMWLVAGIKNLFFAHASREGYEFLHKCIPMIFDILTGVLIYRIMRLVIRRHSSAETFKTYYLPEIVSGIYLLSPFTILTSALWGQVDSVYVFFLLLSFYFVLSKKIPLAFVVYVVAGVIKPQSIILAPLYGLLLIKARSWNVFFKSMLSSITTFYILTMPFFGISALQGMWKLLQSSVNVYPYSSMYTFNYWGITGFWKPDTVPYFMGLTAQQFGYVVWGLSLCYGLYFGFRYLYLKSGRLNERNAALLASFFIFSAVMFLTRMHERYLYPLFSYLILAAGIYTYQCLSSNDSQLKHHINVGALWLVYAVSMILHTINLYYVYIYYYYFLFQPATAVPTSNNVFYSIESVMTVWSYLQLIVYLLFALTIPYYLTRLQPENKK